MTADDMSHARGQGWRQSLLTAAYWLRASRRRQWRTWLVLGLLVGLASGGVVTALSGADRADTAYARFRVASEAFDVQGGLSCAASDAGSGPPAPQSRADREACLARLTDLDAVQSATSVYQYGVQFDPVGGRSVQPLTDTCYSGPGVVSVVGDPSGRYGSELNRVTIVEGRTADPRMADEVVVSREMARRLDLRAGDALRARLVAYNLCLDPQAIADGTPVELTVVGVGVGAVEVPPATGFYVNFVFTTPAFVERHGTDGLDDVVTAVRFTVGVDDPLASFLGEVDDAGLSFEPFWIGDDYATDLQRGISPSVHALRILAALLAFAGVTVLGQLLLRQTSLEASDLHVLRSLGSRRGGRFLATTVWALPVSIIAVVTTGVVATIGSWWMPIGEARIFEPDPGFSLDSKMFARIAALAVLGTIVTASVPAIRLSRGTSPAGADRPRHSSMVEWLTRASASPTAVTGVRMALEPRPGEGGAPVRTAILAITIGLLTVAGTTTFGSSLDHLLQTPRLAGWNWDARIDYPGLDGEEWQPLPRSEVVAVLEAHPGVTAFGLGSIWLPFVQGLEIGEDRVVVSALAFDSDVGDIGPALIDGRAPSAPDELMLGPVTADDLDLGIGDRVVVRAQSGEWEQPDTYQEFTTELEVVGLGVLPAVGDRLGVGASMTVEGVSVFLGTEPELDSLFLRFAPGADPATVLQELAVDLGLPEPDPVTLAEVLTLGEVVSALNVRQVDRVPLLLATLMALVSTAVLAHVLFSTTAARRADLALLRAIGFDRRAVRRTIAWQATATVVVAWMIALPLGIAAGRAVWLLFAERLGAVPEVAAPIALLVIVPAIVVGARVIAIAPAWVISRRSPASALRTE